jgi:hypothetical protein
MAHDNAKVLSEGFAKGMKKIEQAIQNSLHWAAEELVHRALQNRTYTGFTGNTQTSYACGIYVRGTLVEVVHSQSFQERPVHLKIRYGKVLYLEHPYEDSGRGRARKGMVPVNNLEGIETSLKFLNSYKAPKNGVAMVMTTGTEYSEWLEEYVRLDVLSRTRQEAEKVLDRNWKPLPVR